MTIEIPKAVVQAIEDHARDTFPEECCGFLLGYVGDPRRVVESRRAKNTASEDREHRYVVDPLELLHADNESRANGLELIGIYHSHPNHPAAPSEFDRSRAAGWYSYLILCIVNREPKELTAWVFDERTKRFVPEDTVFPTRRPAKRPQPDSES
ncbi:MAG TPA: M67 family metallopeptidase [Thermoplasmata archaeon]|nr:M67 family metallopeptidase [Thermoplasmata archaeon]